MGAESCTLNVRVFLIRLGCSRDGIVNAEASAEQKLMALVQAQLDDRGNEQWMMRGKGPMQAARRSSREPLKTLQFYIRY